MDRLPRAVVEVGVPRGPGAVEGKGQLLVVLVLLTPHPQGLEHFSAQNHYRRQYRIHRCNAGAPPNQSLPAPVLRSETTSVSERAKRTMHWPTTYPSACVSTNRPRGLHAVRPKKFRHRRRWSMLPPPRRATFSHRSILGAPRARIHHARHVMSLAFLHVRYFAALEIVRRYSVFEAKIEQGPMT